MNSFIDIATIVALFINTIALIVIIYQTHIARQSLAIVPAKQNVTFVLCGKFGEKVFEAVCDRAGQV